MEERVASELYDKSIMSDWESFLSDTDFNLLMEESLNIRTYEKKSHKDSNGKIVKGVQMPALRNALESGKTKKGAVYFLMRAVHYWRMMYLTEIKHHPDEYNLGKVVPKKQHTAVMNELQRELEELYEILEGRGVVPEKEYSEMKEDLNDKIYVLEKENKKLKSSIEKEKDSIEEYHKKLAQTECARLQKKISWLEDEIHKISATKNTAGQ